MEIEREDAATYTVVRLRGPIHIGESAQTFHAVMQQLLAEGVQHILLDFTHVNELDSTGLGELIGFLLQFRERQGRIDIINPRERVRNLIRIAGLQDLFSIYPDIESALAQTE